MTPDDPASKSKLKGSMTNKHYSDVPAYEETGDGWLQWYHDLMTDKIKSGHKGFQPESYLINHWPESLLAGE